MDYIGERLLPGQLGHFFVILSLVASAVATFSYFRSTILKTEPEKQDWLRLARASFLVEVISVFAIFGIIFYIIYNHLFEYKYAWQHSSRSLEFKYLLSSFWEGQEGSFLLWSVWHCVLGLLLIRTARKWEAPVMTTVSFAQFCLATMIAGLYFFGHKVGSNPFILLRNEMAAPIFERQDYLSFIKDGNDLNPLLQNYWMVIHPPVLFMGFASTVVPFAFAMAGLWTRNHADWVKPALPWALFSAGVLGLGIMMGGAWAYESLNFGGYWAWDPVENASMVPWLVLVAGIHTLLIYKHTGHSLKASYLFISLAFLLVLYSTFLTRSGVLGDTSVHAFTDLGMNVQLYVFLYVFCWLPAVFSSGDTKRRMLFAGIGLSGLILTYFLPWLSLFSVILSIVLLQVNLNRQIPSIKKEEETSSREFWMFIGALVFFMTAGFIIIATSLPVINNIIAELPVINEMVTNKFTMGEDVVFSYNRVIIFVAIVIGLLTAITQYLKYKQTNGAFFWKKIWIPSIISAVVATLVLAFGNINYRDHGIGYLFAIWVAVVTSLYTLIANGAYIWLGMRGKLSLSGGSVAHLGFGIMLVGILISSSKKEILSFNTSGIYVPLGEGSQEKPGENLTLVKGVPTRMGDYNVTYARETKHPDKPLWYYHLAFKNRNSDEKFELTPNAFINYKGNQGLMANPDAKRYWDHDIFTYITSLPDPDKNTDTSSFRVKHLNVGDTAFYSGGRYILEDLRMVDSLPIEGFGKGDQAAVATIKVISDENDVFTARPILVNARRGLFMNPDSVVAENLVFQLEKAEGNHIDLGVKEPNSVMQYVTLKAYKFPMINLVWLGTILMVIGFIISMIRRRSLNRQAEERETLSF